MAAVAPVGRLWSAVAPGTTPLVAVIGLTMALATGVAPVVAQPTFRNEISAGYRAAHVTGERGETLDRGWFVGAAVRLSPWLDLAVDVGGLYKNRTVAVPGDVTASGQVGFSIHHLLGGVRLNGRREARLIPFGQSLIGGVRSKAELSTAISVGEKSVPMDLTLVSNEFAMSIGGGVDVRVAERIRIRTGLDYLWAPAEYGASAWRFGLGAVVAF